SVEPMRRLEVLSSTARYGRAPQTPPATVLRCRHLLQDHIRREIGDEPGAHSDEVLCHVRAELKQVKRLFRLRSRTPAVCDRFWLHPRYTVQRLKRDLAGHRSIP